MNRRIFRRLVLCAAAALPACSTLDNLDASRLWPFREAEAPERSRAPAGATAYRCEGRQFYVRELDSGSAVWLSLPDRDVRLDRDRTAKGTRYARASTVLELEGDVAALSDGSETFRACKRA